MDTISIRLGEGKHRTLSEVDVCVQRGVVGDRWFAGDGPRHSQVTLMSAAVARLVAHGDMAHHRTGDNFYVELDLHRDNVPPGTRIKVGTTLLVVTEEPHMGCKRFASRFGKDALRWISTPDGRAANMRGIHCEVLESGSVQEGDPVIVVRD